jgi:hypothetical protein
MKPCLKTAATREQKNAGRGGIFTFCFFFFFFFFWLAKAGANASILKLPFQE